MYKIFQVIILLFFILSPFLLQEALALNPQCDWKLKESNSIKKENSIFDKDQKIFLEENKIQSIPMEFNCLLLKPISVKNKLINFELKINSDEKKDLIFSLIDEGGRKISSLPLMHWYDISPNKNAHITIDPSDLKQNSKFSMQKVKTFQLEFFEESSDSIEVSQLDIQKIKEYPNFNKNENLPVQTTLPGFFGLILLSFPIGFVLLNSANFLRQQNFVVKLPWFLAFGFVIYIFVTYIYSHFWISFETVLAFVIVELIILLIYLKKNSPHINFKSFKFDGSFFFFSIVLIISALISISFAESVAWPLDAGDSSRHVPMISITVANHLIYDSESFLPISDVGGWPVQKTYPQGAHLASAGVSFLTDRLPAVSMISIYSFVVFLFPPLLTAIVYKFTKSIFLSSIMFMVSIWLPTGMFWYGDIILGQWKKGFFSGTVGVLVMLTSFMILNEFFENGRKLKLFIFFVLTLIALTFVYSGGYVVLPILIAIVSFLIYYVKNKKKLFLVLITLSSFFISLPLWSSTLLSQVGQKLTLHYSHWKYLENYPFDPSDVLFPFWVLAAVGLVFSCFLLKEKRYRVISITVLFTSLIHIISISPDLALNYAFFYKALRSLGLMFFLSVAIILITINFASNQISLKPSSIAAKLAISRISMVVVLILIVIILLPGFQLWENQMNPKKVILERVPGGNEQNLQFWLLDNSNPEDLILNDLSQASQWYVGFRAQNVINVGRVFQHISNSYNGETNTWEPTQLGAKETLKANKILQHPWDYKNIEETLSELDIKYIYLTDRQRSKHRCGEETPSCYIFSNYWPWFEFSGDARIAMYENHPNLELVLRNGDSAIFKVLN